MIKAVLTGDVVDFSSIRGEERDRLFSVMQTTASEISRSIPLRIEFFQRDSFQILSDFASSAMKIAVLFRATLRGNSPENSGKIWDARISVGIGCTDYESVNVSTPDGRAFLLSGHGLDDIGKNRMAISTDWSEINKELEISTMFADSIIGGWSKAQARLSYLKMLTGESQKEIAAQTGKTIQNVSKILAASKENLISQYIERCQETLEHKIRSI